MNLDKFFKIIKLLKLIVKIIKKVSLYLRKLNFPQSYKGIHICKYNISQFLKKFILIYINLN